MQLPLPTREKILIAPLYWGLGHTTRCIPIIAQALQEHNEVWLAANPLQCKVVKENLPHAEFQFLELPSYQIRYGYSALTTRIRLGLQLRKITRGMAMEQRQIQEWQQKLGFGWIISDARLGLYHRDAHSVLVNHQMSPRYGLGSWAQKQLNRRLIKNMDVFDEIWVPDEAADRLAGSLSEIPPSLQSKSHYIGWLSALQDPRVDKSLDYLFILSGPEPQKSAFQNWAVDFLASSDRNGMIVGGEKDSQKGLMGHQNSIELARSISQSRRVISRSGYSTLMDLKGFGNIQIYLSATAGQPEQEYLYRYHTQSGHYFSIDELR